MGRDDIEETQEATVLGGPLVPSPSRLPVVSGARRRRRGPTIALCLLALVVAGGGYYWWTTRPPALPPGIVSGNGRLEADEIDIATKFPERVARLLADEGDLVKAGQVLALMDVQNFDAQLKKAKATVDQTERMLAETRANVDQQKAQVLFSRQELARARELTRKEFMTKEMLDQRVQQMNAATAVLAASEARVSATEHAVDAAKHDVELLEVNIADSRLLAPVDGVVQYKIANVGEVLPIGGKVFTILDTSYVYMDVYLPTKDAGNIRLGDDALIVLDAMPQLGLPAKVVFLATEAQFTPKAVETKTERDKLMFRVRVRIDRDLLQAHRRDIRTGLPGVAYVKLAPDITWPSALAATILK